MEEQRERAWLKATQLISKAASESNAQVLETERPELKSWLEFLLVWL